MNQTNMALARRAARMGDWLDRRANDLKDEMVKQNIDFLDLEQGNTMTVPVLLVSAIAGEMRQLRDEIRKFKAPKGTK